MKTNIEYQSLDKDYLIEYIKALLSNYDAQKKYNLVFITFNIAIIAFLLDKIALNNNLSEEFLHHKTYFIINVVFYFFSAGFFTIWLALIHRFSIEAIDLFITLDIEKARRENYPELGNFKKWGWIDVTATVLMIAAIFQTIILLLKCNYLI